MGKRVTTYDEFTYEERGLIGEWIPFGCLLQLAKVEDAKDVLEILSKAGFATRRRDTDAYTNQIHLL